MPCHVDEVVDAEGDEGEDDEEHNDDDGNNVVLLHLGDGGLVRTRSAVVKMIIALDSGVSLEGGR